MADQDHNLSFSPYNYCINNPIILVDPNGMDWFQNEKTGDVVYVSSLHQGAEDNMTEGWKWMGENNMFSDGSKGTDDGSIIENSKDLTDDFHSDVTKDSDGNISVSTSALFTGDNAKKFMSKNGYDFLPTQQVRYENNQSFSVPGFDGQYDAKPTFGSQVYVTEKSAYIPKGSIENEIKPNSDNFLKFGGLGYESVNRVKITYTNNAIIKGLNSFSNYLNNITSPDYRSPTVYSNWFKYPNNIKLLNLYGEQYGRK